MPMPLNHNAPNLREIITLTVISIRLRIAIVVVNLVPMPISRVQMPIKFVHMLF